MILAIFFAPFYLGCLMQMRLQHIAPLPGLKAYIDKMWVFESSGRVPNADMKLIVPNGHIKLVVPFRNGLFGKMEGFQHLSQENKMTLIGICDLPSIVDVKEDAPSGTIGVEFSPLGAYRFFKLPQSSIRNQIYNLEDVLGKTVREIEHKIGEAQSIEEKIQVVQRFLYDLFRKTESDAIFDHCVKRIKSTWGTVSVKQLEKESGYSARWLNMKFGERLGISPKNLCSITRFLKVYEAMATDSGDAFLHKEFYQLYYDQAHFIKEFKRFTGTTPQRLEDGKNDFGKIFYK